MSNKKTISAECTSCKGTGLYSGYREPKGVAVVCSYCNGTGEKIIEYTPFTGRKEKKGITKVSISYSTIRGPKVGPHEKSISYESFQAGEMPTT